MSHIGRGEKKTPLCLLVLHCLCLCPPYRHWDMTHWVTCVCHDLFVCAPWLVQVCAMRHDSFRCVPWLIHVCAMTHSYVCHDLFICVSWGIRVCDMTHSYVWYDSLTCATRLIHMCDMTHPCAWPDSFTCITWLIQMHDMTQIYVDTLYLSDIGDNIIDCVFICVILLIHMCAVSHSYVWHDCVCACMYVCVCVCVCATPPV